MSYAYTPESLGEHWGVSAATVRNLVRKGILRAFRIGPQIRIRPSDVEAYEKAQQLEPEAIPATCGVYILWSEGAISYVGRSTSLRTRIAAHRASGRPFDNVRVIPCDEPASIWLEKELVRVLQPTQNLLRYERQRRASELSLNAGGIR